MGNDAERQAESKKILERVAREAGSDAATFLGATARRTGAHLAARDADPEDAIEMWGSRIGRMLGLVTTIGLFVWLVVYLLRG
jgi:hypothetical protein